MFFSQDLQTLPGLGLYLVISSYYLFGFYNIQFFSYLLTLIGYVLINFNNYYNFLTDVDDAKDLFSNIYLLFCFTLIFNIVKTVCNFVFYFGFVETIISMILIYYTFETINSNLNLFVYNQFKLFANKGALYVKKLYFKLNNLFNIFNTEKRQKMVDTLKNNFTLYTLNTFMSTPNICNSVEFDQTYKNMFNNNINMNLLDNQYDTNIIEDLDNSEDESVDIKTDPKDVDIKQIEKNDQILLQKDRQKALREKIKQKKNARTGNGLKNVIQETDKPDINNLLNNPNMATMMQQMMQDPQMQNMIKNMTGGSGKIDKKKMNKILGKI